MWFWIALFLVLGVITLYYSRHQPFPEISGRFAGVLIIIGVILWISTTAPRPTSESVPAIVAAFIGGVLLCMGAISLMGDRWAEMGQTEQIGSFAVASVLVLLEIYLAFRGLIVGVQGISWSKSGLRQVRRGLIHGPNGAITHFERSWDMEDPWINSMSHAALALIHRHSGNEEEAREHVLELEKAGGWESVDQSWLDALEKALSQVRSGPLRDD